METKSWIAQSEPERNATMRALKDRGYKAWHGASKVEFSAEANQDDREQVERIVLAHAPGAHQPSLDLRTRVPSRTKLVPIL
jgi:hypothetical protein